MRLLAVAESAAMPPDAPPGSLVTSHSAVPSGDRRTVNRRERQMLSRIADRRLFQHWQDEMRGYGHDPDVTIGVLLLGDSMSALDRRSKRRKGWARGELRKGIGVFQQLIASPRPDQHHCRGLDKAGQRRYQIG